MSVLAHGRYADAHVSGDALLESDSVSATLGTKRFRYAGAVALQVTHGDPQRVHRLCRGRRDGAIATRGAGRR